MTLPDMQNPKEIPPPTPIPTPIPNPAPVRGHYVGTIICLPTPSRPLPSMVHKQLLVVM